MAVPVDTMGLSSDLDGPKALVPELMTNKRISSYKENGTLSPLNEVFEYRPYP